MRLDRLHVEPKKTAEQWHDTRSPGRHDRDRLLYSSAFRRLAGVTQVVGPLEGYIFHNRLTHTIEVAQVARSLAEDLLGRHPTLAHNLGGIDPDVVEAAALAHDLGHPPFGHVAEKQLDALVRQAGDPDGFEGNAQSFRIVVWLAAHRRRYRGLNPCRATLNAILKYPCFRARSKKSKSYKKFGAYRTERQAFLFARAGFGRSARQGLEASIMDYADDVAYSVHDFDDFTRAGLVSVDLLKFDAGSFQRFLTRWEATGEFSRRTVRKYADRLQQLLWLIMPSGERYRGTFSDRAVRRTIASFLISKYIHGVKLVRDGLDVSEDIKVEQAFLQRIVWEQVITSPSLGTQQVGQKNIITNLFRTYLTAIRERNREIVPAAYEEELHLLGRARRGTKRRRPSRAEIRLAADIVAGLTDHQASLMHARFSGMNAGSVADLYAR
ncbi:MAG: dNTP triphosphohydrolase [Acidobacteria bacterium]|nr:dNTP triphosphohydrolase [Acidobacteriota bacterium]